jgi:L-asparaginase II
MANGLGLDSPALGIALKISDGDLCNRARPAVTLEVLNQLNALTGDEKAILESFGPSFSLKNSRDIEIGTARPAFKLNSIISQYLLSSDEQRK